MLITRSKLVAVILILFSNNCFSHEEGGNYSGAIIDPLRVHHAHIENEQKVDFSFIEEVGNIDGKNAFSHSLELALKWDDNFLWGSEIFIPYSDAGGSGAGIGDIEVQLIKHAFVNEPETILTGSFGMSLPTGNKSKGLGGENTAIEAALFLDKAYKNWYWGLNLGLGTVVSGENETALGLASAVSYSFIDETSDLASPKPRQAFVSSVSIELVSTNILSGSEEGTNVVTVVPGLHLWHPKSSWLIRFGVEIPISSDKENDRVYLLQIGTHKNWGKIFY